MKISVQAMKELLSPEELIANISKEKLELIKGKGKLQAYVIAHEGTSQPKVLDDRKAKKLNWPKETIQKIASKIKTGIKFFVDHGKDTNSHANRKPVGEVVGSFVKEIGNKLSNIVIGHFENPDDVNSMDVNSMEADVSIDESNNNVVNLNELSGIALGSSSENSPAFPGAVRLASLQCFDKEENPDGKKGGQEMPTFDEVKQFVKDRNVWPSQLFDEDVIKRDHKYADVFGERDKLKIRVEELEKENKKITEQSADALKSSLVNSASTRIKELLPEGLTKKQETFIMKGFKPDKMEDLSDEGLVSYIKDAEKEYSEVASIFNDKKEEDPESEDDKSDDDSGKKSSGDIVDDVVASILED